MKATLNAETLKNSGNLHAIFNVSDLQIVDDYWINTTIYELIGNFDKLTVKSYTIDDDFNVNFEAENEPIKAEIFSHGSIVISPEMVKALIGSNGETVEIFQDRNQIVFYIDGKSRCFFDADFLDDIENKRIEKEAEEENARREWIEKQDEKYTRANIPEKPTSIILNPCEIFKGIAHCFDKHTSATIENGILTICGEKGVAYRNIGNANISTNQIRHWIKTWKAEKALQTLTQFPDGSAKLNGTIRNDLTRPQWLEWDYSRKIRRLFDIGFTVYDVENLPKFLKPLHVADKFVLTDGNIQMVFPVGTVKKSLVHFKGNTLFSVGKDAQYYMVITKEGTTDYDVIPALSIDPKGHNFPEIMMDFKVDEPFDLESAKKAPTNDASTATATNTRKDETAEQTQADATETAKEETAEQEQKKLVKIATVESSAPLATVTPSELAERPSVRASEPAPVESAPQPSDPAEPMEAPQPQPSEPSRADEPSSRAEKPFEIGTYTTKKGKVKTAIKFNTPPTPSQIEALKTAFYWEYNGTWNGSPRKLPEIFKH